MKRENAVTDNVTLTDKDISRLYCFERDNRCFLFEKDSLSSLEINQDMRDTIELLHKESNTEKVVSSNYSQRHSIRKYVYILKELKRRKLILPEKSNSGNLAIKQGKNLTVFIQCSYRCNLNCRYCLADYKEQEEKQEKYYSLDHYKEIIDFVFSEYSDRKTFLFNFFGGEPPVVV